MRILPLLFLLFSPFSLLAQNLSEAYRGSLKYNYYKLDINQAQRLYKYSNALPIDSYLTNLVLEVPNDSFGKVLPKESGHYIYTHVQGNVLYYQSYSKPFIRVHTSGVLGEGKLKLYDFEGKAVTSATIKREVKKDKWENVAFDQGCGCYSFKDKAYGQMIRIEHQGQFDFYKITNEGLSIPSIDRSNPYAGQKVFPGYMVFNKPKYRHFDTLKIKAFVVTNEGWPLRRKLEVFLTSNYKEVQIGRIKPVSPGAYVYEFVISDSLRLNDNITVTLKNKGTFIKSNTVFIEDYELKKASYSSRMLKSAFNKGEKIEVVVDAFDANSMPMLDTRVKVKLALESAEGLIPEDYKTHDSILQNLFSYNEMIDETGTSLIEIPESAMLPVKGYYRVTVDQINSEGEYKTQSHRFYHNAKASYNKIIQVGNKVLGKEYLDGKEQKGGAITIKEYHNGIMISSFQSAFPLDYSINPSTNYITISRKDSALWNQYVQDASASVISVSGKRTHDSVNVSLSNPWGLDVYYRIYRNKEIISKGFGTEINYKAEDASMWPYYVLWGYQWAGQEHFYETPLTVKEKELKVEINQPKAIFPGEKVDVSIRVTDYKNKPLGRVNLTAYAVNMEFPYIPLPEMPYFGRRFPQMSSTSRFYANQLSYSGSRKLTNKLFSLINVADTNYYLNYLFPGKKLLENKQENDFEKPEFIPTIFQEGVAQNIVNIWLDDHLIYSRINENTPHQIIRYPKGVYDVKIRTYGKFITIKQVALLDYTKHFFSVDMDKCTDSKVQISDVESFILTEDEYRAINQQTFWVDNSFFLNDTVWVENNGMKRLLYVRNGNYHKSYWYKKNQKQLISLNGLKAGPTVLRMNKDTLYFNFEPGKYYVYEKGILSRFPMPYLPLNREVITSSGFNLTYNLDGKPYYFNNETKKVKEQKADKALEKVKALPWYETLRNYSYAKRHKEKNANFKVFNPAQIPIIRTWLVNQEEPSFSYAGYNGISTFQTLLKKGKYTAVFITKKGKVFIKKDIDLNTKDFYFLRLQSNRFEKSDGENIEAYREVIHRISRPEIRAANLFPETLRPEWNFKSDTSQYGSILGILKDKVSWREMNGATVFLEQDGYIKNAVVSNYWGEFIFRNVPEGDYMLKIMQSGYRHTTIDKLRVRNTKTTLLNLNIERNEDYFTKLEEPVQPIEKFLVEESNYGNGQINIKVVDIQTGEVLIGASVGIYQNDKLIKGAVTDIFGDASISNLPNGALQMRINYIGYDMLKLNLDLNEKASYTIKAPLKSSSAQLDEVMVVYDSEEVYYDDYAGSPVYKESYGGMETKSSIEISRLPVRGTTGVIAAASGFTSIDGSAPIIRGGRSEQTITYVDGMPVRGNGVAASGYFADSFKVSDLKNKDILKDALGLLGDKTPPNRLRTNFKDYGFWVPNLITDNEGMSYFSVRLPDNITQWQTIVPAMDHRRNTGLETSNIKAFLPYTAQLGLPRFLVRGDTALISGKVFNYTDSSINVNALFEVDGQTLFTANEDVKRQASFNTTLTASSEDSLNVSFIISNALGFKEGEQRPVGVYNDFIEKSRVQSITVSKDTAFTIAQESNEEFGIIVFNDKRDFLLEQIQMLKSYNYGCIEQTASKLSALLAEKQLCQVIGKTFKDEKMLKRMMGRLAKFQKINGSWGWWQNDKTNEWITIYVTKVLARAQALGYNSFAFTKGMNYIKRNQKKFNTRLYLESLILLSQTGLKTDLGKFSKLIFKDLDDINKLLYLRTQQLQGVKELSKEVMRIVKKDACGRLYWGGSSSIFYNDRSFATMIALEILANEKAKPRTVKAIEKGLFEAACRYSYMNTLQRALLIGYLLDNMDTETDLDVKKGFFINDQKVIDFPKRYDSKGEAINLKYVGQVEAIVMVVRKDKVRNASADSADFNVKTVLYQNGKRVNTLELGSNVELKVNISNRLSADFVMVEIPIPAGCSYGTSELPRFVHEVYREYRRNKVIIYCTELLAGDHSFSISLEPRFKGTYTLLPTKAEQMYFPENSGNNGVKKVVVK